MVYQLMKYAVCLAVGVMCVSCASTVSLPEVSTAPYVDLERYQGKWYEIARLPAWFQKGCLQSTATYELDGSGGITVVNECVTEDGTRKKSSGTASVVDEKSGAKLEVLFDNWLSRLFPSLLKGKYWILYIDTDYRTVIVGTPDRKYLWIMAITPALGENEYQQLLQIAGVQGFDTETLIKDSDRGL
jgi:apolipoprotein D and lipocalin family protein